MIALILLLIVGVASPTLAIEQDLLSVLASRESISRFTSLISTHAALVQAAQLGNVTVLAPVDDAFDQFFSAQTAATNFSTWDDLDALLSYHILKGVHTTAFITEESHFIPTFLNNISYTNLTGTQVVEAISENGTNVFKSAVNRAARLTEDGNDLVFFGGVVHILDAVLTPPLGVIETVTEAPLPYFIDLLSLSVLNNQLTGILQQVSTAADTTYFAINNPDIPPDVLNQTRSIDSIMDYLHYGYLPNQVVYSSMWKNGSSFATGMAGMNLTITMIGEATYVNDARVTQPDILVANGVLHVIDQVLNSSHPDARPTVKPPEPSAPASGSHELSLGIKVAIGAGGGVLLIIIVACLFFFARKRRRRGAIQGDALSPSREVFLNPNDDLELHEMESPLEPPCELDAPPRFELSDRNSRCGSRMQLH